MKMNRYHKMFLESFTAENIISLFSRYKNAAKEITESLAMLEAAKKVDVNIDECTVVVVGDGCSPRTGAIFAYYTKAEVISVDPNANLEHWEEHLGKQYSIGQKVERLSFINNKIENLEFNCHNKAVIVVWPHSHADMNKLKILNYTRRIDINMPCCVGIPSEWSRKPHITYTDFNVLSPKRDIHIWDTGE